MDSNTSYVLIHHFSSCSRKYIFQNSIRSFVVNDTAVKGNHKCHMSIQIHPMFLFITFSVPASNMAYPFKYILCSYSSILLFSGKIPMANSNTSYVLIHHWRPFQLFYIKIFKYILCSYSSWCKLVSWYGDFIQIHPMFLFISHLSYFTSSRMYSNTSYVLIHRILRYQSKMEYLHSNTSYVLIHQKALLVQLHKNLFKYILCSYSSGHCESITILFSIIQIHPMFLFIKNQYLWKNKKNPFKYILCSYSSYNMKRRICNGIKFKYILCSYSSRRFFSSY